MKIKRLICSVVLSATLLSSVAAAAPASVNGCTPNLYKMAFGGTYEIL